MRRTHHNLSQIATDKLETGDKKALETWTDCVGRCMMADKMITEKSPMTAMMFQGQLVDFNPEVERLSKECMKGSAED